MCVFPNLSRSVGGYENHQNARAHFSRRGIVIHLLIFHFFLIYWLFFFDTIIIGSFAFLFCALFYIPFPTRSCFLFSFHRLRGLVILNTGFASHPFRPLDPLVPVCAGFMYLLRHPQFSLLFFILTVPFSSRS